MASLIRNLWDTVWDMWNARNHILHSTDGSTKSRMIRKVNAIIEYHHVRGLVGIPECCRFLFNTSLSSIMYFPFRQQLSWLATIPSART